MVATREQSGSEMTGRHSGGTLVCMSATEEQMSLSRITARLFAWLAPLLFLFAALAAVPVSATASAKALCVSHNRTGGNSTSAVQWCPAQGPRTGALNWEKLPGEYVPGGSGFANAARMAGQISADWAAENSGELGGLRPTYDEAAIATSGPVGELGDAVVGKVAETAAPAVKRLLGKFADVVGQLFGKAAESTTGSLDTIPEGLRIQPYYPPNSGFAEAPVTKALQPGEMFDRFGLDTGRFASPAGTPAYMRSLPPGATESPYSMFRVLKPLDVQSGTAAPWFGQPGGGVQYQFSQSIQSLIKNGYIERVGG